MQNRVISYHLPDDLSDYLEQEFTSAGAEYVMAMERRDLAKLCASGSVSLIVLGQRDGRSPSLLSGLRRMTYAPIVQLVDAWAASNIRPALKAGVDLCVSADLPPETIYAYLAAQLRRYTAYNHLDQPTGRDTAPIQHGELFLDPLRHMAKVRGRAVDLRPREFSLLLYLMRNPGIVLTVEDICDHAWGNEGSYGRGISGPICLLRKAVEPDPQHPIYIETVRSVGYRLIAKPDETCDIYSENEVDL